MDEHVVIAGAGPASLAAAWAIRRAGLDPLVVEQADAVAASWRGRHDHLRLGTQLHRIDRTDGGWVLALKAGSLTTAHAVIATGSAPSRTCRTGRAWTRSAGS
jgi:cation diffusion facilitator CzcD-associated flavoprotein CzcO